MRSERSAVLCATSFCPVPRHVDLNRVRYSAEIRLSNVPLFQHLFNGAARKECVDVLCESHTVQLTIMYCANGDPLGKKLLSIKKDDNQTFCKQCAEKSRFQQTAGGGEGGGQEGYEKTLVSPFAPPRLPPKGHMRLVVLMVDDEMCLFLNAAQRQKSGFDGMRGSFHTGVQCS